MYLLEPGAPLSTQSSKIVSFNMYPNPTTSSKTVNIQNTNGNLVNIYNMLGQEIQTLVNKFQITGNYSVNLDAKNLSSGIYFYKLQVGSDFVDTKKMVLLR